MSADSPNLPPEPEAPADWECCGSDCGDACIWQIYYRERAAWQAAVASAQPTAKDSDD